MGKLISWSSQLQYVFESLYLQNKILGIFLTSYFLERQLLKIRRDVSRAICKHGVGSGEAAAEIRPPLLEGNTLEQQLTVSWCTDGSEKMLA